MSGKKKNETKKINSLEKIRQINKVSVFYGERKVGELAMTPTQRCAFEYDTEWLKSGFSIAPRQLDLKEGLFIAPAEPFYGNFGIFEDSLPDGYGRYLLNRILQKEGIDDTKLTPVQRLSIVGTSGMGALLNQSIHFPALTYENLLALTGVITQDPVQVEEMFRRMVFNVLAENKDDHAKNFSFYYRNGIWELAPAYDLTQCSGGYNGEHATTANGSGNPTIEDMLVAGEGIRISRKRGGEIIDQVREGCKGIL